MNVFTPLSKYNMMKTIGKFLNKEVEYIIPNEIAIPKIVEKTSYANNDVLFLDFGNTRTRVIYQKSGSIEGFEIIEIGLNDLLKKIKEKS
jgi:cell division ATPase FtsA